MNTLLFFAVFSGLTICYMILGFLVSKNIKTTSDYFLAGRDLGLFSVTMTLVATQIGGGMLVGTSEDAYLYGLYGLLYTVGMTIGFLLLAGGFAKTLQSLQVSTTAEVFEKRYQSSSLKKIASLLSILTMSGILIGQIVGSRTIINTLGLGQMTELAFITFWLFVILYTMVGGLKAVVATDVFQVLFIMAIFTGIFLYCNFFGPAFAWGSILTLQREQFGTMPLSLNTVIATAIMPALFSLIEQDLAQRFFAARSQRIATLSALASCICLILFALVPIYFGMQAKLLGITVPIGVSPLIPVIEFLTNEFMVILCSCAIMAAITSTADSLLCAISSHIAQDFDLKWVGFKDAVTRSQAVTLASGIVALIASYFVPPNVITILVESYAISVSCLLVPLIWAYFNPRVSKQAAMASVISGFVAFVAIQFWDTDLPKALLPVFISACGYVVGTFFSKN